MAQQSENTEREMQLMKLLLCQKRGEFAQNMGMRTGRNEMGSLFFSCIVGLAAITTLTATRIQIGITGHLLGYGKSLIQMYLPGSLFCNTLLPYYSSYFVQTGK